MSSDAPNESRASEQAPGTPEVTRHPWVVRLALLLVGIVVPLAVFEIGLRVAGFEFHLYPEKLEFGYPDPKILGRYFVPHDRYLWAQSDYDTRVAFARAMDPDLLMMGCSCTEWGKFHIGLQAAQAEIPGAPELSIANLGCSGWSSYQGRLQLEHDVIGIAPDVITIFYGWNDHWIGFGIEDKDAATYSRSVLIPLEKLRVVQFVTQFVVSLQAEGERELGAGARPERVSLPDFRDNLETMVDTARANGISPVLVTAPTTHEKGNEPEFLLERHLNSLDDLIPLHQAYARVVREVAAERDVPLCDLEAIFAKLPREEVRTYIVDDGIHFTPAGGRKVGRYLHATLAAHGLLPGVEPGDPDPGPGRETE
jgi:lysophospholipase L1-like esterase